MKYKREKVIRDISILVLSIVLILGKLGKVKITIMLAWIGAVVFILFGIYCIYKGLKLGGAFAFSLATGAILVILSYHYNSYILSVPIPLTLAIMCVLSYKLVYRTGDKETVKHLKKMCGLGIALCSMIQIVMIALLFIKH